MAYIGNTPAASYTSFAKQDFTTSATTSYTLDNPVANANELALFINFVRQEPTTAYSASGTSLTLTSATSASDDMYCVYLGKAVQTVNPPNASIGSSQVSADLITGQTALTLSPDTTDEIILSDAGTLKRADISVLGNATAFRVTLSGNQTISHDTLTRVTFDTEEYDTHSAFASNIFTVPTNEGGKYAFSYLLFYDDLDDTDFCLAYIEVDGTIENGTQDQRYGSAGTQNTLIQSAGVIVLTAGQTVEVVTKHGIGSNQELRNSQTYFQMHKLIGV